MKPAWTTFLGWVLAGVLIWAGGAKALDPAALAENIAGFRLVPWPMAVAGAFYLPWLELVVGIGLLVPRWRTGSAWLAALLFTAFSLVWAITWVRGLDVTCGCFGSTDVSTASWSFARAAVLTAFAWMLLLLKRTQADAEA